MGIILNGRLLRTPILVFGVADYNRLKIAGYEPLIDQRFEMDIFERIEIQRMLFGTGHTPAENEKFYRWCWEHLPHRCEETMKPLREYSSVYISHILTRGAHPDMAHDPRNINILSFEAHNRWENGDREKMRIYEKNCRTISLLRAEYSKVSK